MTTPGLADQPVTLPHARLPPSHGTGYDRAWGRGVAVILPAVLGVALTACGGQQPVKLPPKASPAAATSAAATPSPAASPSTSPPAGHTKAAAAAAYLASWPAASQAERAGSAARARKILAGHFTPSYATYVISRMRPDWRKHEVAWGQVVVHIKKVSVFKSRHGGKWAAVVVDCQDASHAGLARASTGKVISSTLGSRHEEMYASLGYEAGRWLIANIEYVGSSCTG